MKKIVESKPKQFSIGTLCRLMDTCLPAQIDDERDMQSLIDKLWPALVTEHEVEKSDTPITDFLAEHAPVYEDHRQLIGGNCCCEKAILWDRERLSSEAKKLE